MATSDPIILPQQTTITADAGLQAAMPNVSELLSNADLDREAFFKMASAEIEPQAKPPSDPTPPPAKPASKEAPKSDAASAPTEPEQKGKVAGPPKSDATPQPAQTTASDDDIPRDYRSGSIKAEQWNKMHVSRDQLKAEVATLKEQLQKAQTAGASEEITKRLESLQRERDDLTSKFEQVAFERSPRFEAQFKPRIEAAVSLAKDAVGHEHATKIEQLLAMPSSEFRNRQLRDIAKELQDDPLAIGRLSNAIGEIDKVNAEKQAYAQRGSETWRQWQEEDKSVRLQRTVQEKHRAQALFDQELQQWRGFELLKSKDGDANHNSEVERRISQAREIFSGEYDEPDKAKASLWAALGPDLASELLKSQKAYSALQKELNSMRKSSPTPASDASNQPSHDDGMPANMGYADALAAMMQRDGLLR